MLGYKLDFSSCVIMPGFGKSSHICIWHYASKNLPSIDNSFETLNGHIAMYRLYYTIYTCIAIY